jgi:trk system potassium uptake protein TrkA
MPEGVLVGLVSRNGSLFIPRGDTELRDGDLVTFIGLPQQMPVLRKQFQGQEPKLDDVVIMGGGTVGLHLARILETRKPSVKLLDWDPNRCEYLSSELSKTEVICRDASSRTSLEEERVDQTDVFVATTNDDERNIMAGVLAKEVGAARCVAVVHQPDFAPLVAKLGIDHAVTPRACVANRVLRIVRRDSASSVTVIEEGHVEVLEFTVTGNSPILGKSLKDARIPRDALVANILRGDKVIVPHGDDEFHAGDSAVVLAKMNALEAVRKLFAR